MDRALDKDLYKKAKSIADKTFKEKTSAYKSMFIVKKYQDMGGKFSGKKSRDLGKWREEKWIQVVPFLEKGKVIECGSGADKKSCRPTLKKYKTTPITIKELIDIHGKQKLVTFAKRKKKEMNKRADWKKLMLK